MKSILYYTDNRLGNPIYSKVQDQLSMVWLPIVSVSLKPIKFGQNIVVIGERSYPTMVKQIIAGLKISLTDYVFFCEHDVLYPESHFDFAPPRDDIFYYNENVWRWWFGNDKAIRHERMLPLSVMCANRKFVLDHYLRRQQMIQELGWDEIRSREPRWARLIGYEPGTKKKKRGGFSDDDFSTWKSEYPVIDIRHKGTFSSPKIHLKDFKHKPKWWKEIPIEEIPGWDLRKMFHL